MIEARIHAIQEAFQIGKLEGEMRGLQSVFNFENELDKELVSVAMEGCSMAIAIISLKNKSSLINWHLFVAEKGQNYLSQIHVGLGWALAELQLPVQQYISDIEAKWQLRVLDGYGYYSGLFRRRDAVRNMLIPTEIPTEMQAGFDQGLGRLLYYLSNGESQRLERSIALFPDSRHANFWRGIGIAVTFIGTDNPKLIDSLFEISGSFKNDFILGATMASVSLEKADAISQYSNIAIKEIFKTNKELAEKVIENDAKSFESINAYLGAF